MTNADRNILNMIEVALKRIQKDEYGLCELSGRDAAEAPEAVPWAKHCISCQRS
jgi:RNA polymerase-binding transcription factor DksA